MKTLFTDGWKFWEAPFGTDFQEALDHIDNFKCVRLPHDYMINDPKDLYRDSTGWYTKDFEVTSSDLEKELFIIFDGIYMDSVVYVNGEEAGEWKYGYSQFVLNITEYVKEGTNTIFVAARCKFPNTRWYSGAGIYRDVWLCKYGKTYIPENGIYVHTSKIEDADTADYRMYVNCEVTGPDRDSVELTYGLFDAADNNIEITECSDEYGNVFQDAADTKHFHKCFLVKNVSEWDVKFPNLYRLKVTIKGGEDTEVTMGFRDVSFNPEKGFFLNGRNMKLNGVCLHHDLGALGSAYNHTAMRRRLIQLKEMGVNALRLTHNMYAPGVIALADEMGFLLISEAFDMWEGPKTEYDYARFFPKWHERDVASWVRRDRNHPAVILWSIGNEIYDTHASERGQEITLDLKQNVEKHDPLFNGRATIGSNYMPWEMAQKCADILKLAGYNYAENYYEQHHREHPDWVIYGSETYSIVQSRGIYHFPLDVPTLSDTDEQCSSLGNSTTSWGADSIESCICRDRDYEFSMGQFIWTGYDYIGEPTPYHTKNSYFGLIDTAGFYKDAFYAWKSAWVSCKEDPFVHVFPYWDFNEGQEVDIRICSNAPCVELFVNGKSFGKKELTHAPHSGYKIFADYRLPYEKGEIIAVAYDENNNEIARQTRKSFGNTDSFKVEIDHRLDKYGAKDILFAEISALDKNGNPVENASDYVKVSVKGGKLLGLDNGDSTDYDSYQADVRKLFVGKLLAIVEPEGDPAKVEIEVNKAEVVPVRTIKLEVIEGSRSLDASCTKAKVVAHIYPENATHRELVFRALNKNGTEANVARVLPSDSSEKTGSSAVQLTADDNGTAFCEVEALGDGSFTLRCEAYDGRDVVSVMSILDFEITGIGAAYLDPYGFIPGSLYTSHMGVVGNGNEHGVASARGEATVITYSGIDFGKEGSDEITVPIFTLNDDAYDFEVWKGIPGEADAKLLKAAVYQKKSIWNVYQPDTWTLSERLTGIQTISFKVYQKFHIKGFSFTRQLRAFTDIKTVDADSIYGDTFTRKEDTVEGIGNNVTLAFDEIDFGQQGTKAVILCGRTPNPANTVHLRLVKCDDPAVEIKEILEFPGGSDYREVEFAIGERKGKWDITFVFLPGSNFDFKSFRFIPEQV